MLSRLVLGCGRLGHQVVSTLDASDLHVLDPEASRVETLRTESVATQRADVTDESAIAGYENIGVVFVAGDEPEQNLNAARAAASAYPDAVLVAYVGEDATVRHRNELAEVADEVVDPGIEVTDRAVGGERTGDAERLRDLRATLSTVEGALGVFTHANPDPDAIASGMALARLAESFGVEADLCYFGEIAHQENRAFVNLLDVDMEAVDAEAAGEYDGVALVDHSRPGVNDGLPEDTPVDVVIDHHPPRGDVSARYLDIRDDVGATSTLLAGYVRQAWRDVHEDVATALLYGIRVDTKDFTREITPSDFDAAAYLLPHADTDVLERVESPSLSADTLDTVARAIRNREIRGTSLASGVGPINDRDVLSQAADRLLAMEGVTTTLVYGFLEGTIYVSARSRDPDQDLGAVLRTAFGDVGSAGGHGDMAGAQLPLGLFGQVEEEAEGSLSEILADVVAERFFDALAGRSPSPPAELPGVAEPDETEGSADVDEKENGDAEADDGSEDENSDTGDGEHESGDGAADGDGAESNGEGSDSQRPNDGPGGEDPEGAR